MQNIVNGDLSGIRNATKAELTALYDAIIPSDEFITYELICKMTALSAHLHREISVYIARDGEIKDVSIGETGKVSMPDMRLVRNSDRLCGVRCIHTHPGGDGRLSGVDLGTLRSMKLDSMAAIGVMQDGKPANLYAAFLGEKEADTYTALIAGPLRPYKLPNKELMNEIQLADTRLKLNVKNADESISERAILVGIENDEPYDTLDELAELAKTAGATVVGRSLQKRRSVDNATYIGSGKAEELSLMASELEADLFIFDDELSAVQLRNLEGICKTRVIDRTSLILDIFAQRAQSREGKLQVELAQMQYGLTKLIGKGEQLSRLGGGIGTRGPGEKKLEIDRRRIKRRIFELNEELCEIDKQRELRRDKREASRIPLVALVGYTNAGKSTLLNALTKADVLAADMLFATLDPVVRQVTLPNGAQALFSDTVGFINKLPHDLVQAFKSTLEEVKYADLILHVIDISSPYAQSQKEVVEDVLASLGAAQTPRIDVYNKTDNQKEYPKGTDTTAAISALNKEGLDELLSKVEKALSASRTVIEVVIPYNKYEAMALLHSDGRIISELHDENGTAVKAELSESTLWKLKKLLE